MPWYYTTLFFILQYLFEKFFYFFDIFLFNLFFSLLNRWFVDFLGSLWYNLKRIL